MKLIYDIETYPNVFTFAAADAEGEWSTVYEISERVDERQQIIDTVYSCDEMIGYNNFCFDYPVLHELLTACPSVEELYNAAMAIIKSSNSWGSAVWKPIRPQVDLYLIHHFNNKARAVSLKLLEFNMRMDSIQDLPYAPGTTLSAGQIDELKKYNAHDVEATRKFYNESRGKIEFRKSLGAEYVNKSDAGIGKYYLQKELNSRGVTCHKSVQSPRDYIDLGTVIFPYIKFSTQAFNDVLEKFRSTTVVDTRKSFGKLEREAGGLTLSYGTGGIHGAIKPAHVTDCIDLDVTSFYPNIGIVNRVYPEHLGETFVDIYAELAEKRKLYAKGTPQNAMYKLALNATYGDSNNKHGPFYDPRYTMTITINGQLLLSMLIETVLCVPGLRLIQANTDGITVKLTDNANAEYLNAVCAYWQKVTGLRLEENRYSDLWIRDCNNYIARYTDGRIKRKGAYEYELDWHQDHSALVVQKAASEHLINGANITEYIHNHIDHFDFCLRTKVPRSSKLMHGDTQIQNISRYYVSTQGRELKKLMPPLKNKTEWRTIGINKGYPVSICNDMSDFCLTGVDYEWYIKEAEKLVGVFK